jgi:5-methylcytosine-specific restriction endonuclease McrA
MFIDVQDSAFLKKVGNIYSSHRQRARKYKVELPYGIDDLRAWVTEKLAGRTSPLCDYCHCYLSLATFTVDHRRPLVRGGLHSLTNLAVCCMACNLAKGPLNDLEWGCLLTYLDSIHPFAKKSVLARLKAGAKAIRS